MDSIRMVDLSIKTTAYPLVHTCRTLGWISDL
jgi:hypothetical protein